MGLFDEKVRTAIYNIDDIKKIMVDTDGLLTRAKDSLSQEDFESVIQYCGRCRLLLSQCGQILDKVSVVASNQARELVIGGFQPRENTLGNTDIRKNDSENVISDILGGKIKNVKQLAQRLS